MGKQIHQELKGEKEKMSPRNMRKIDTNFVNLGVENPTVEGTLIEKSSMTIRNNVVGRYKLEQDDQTIVTVLGSTKIDDLLAQVPTGLYIKLSYLGDLSTSSGMKLKDVSLEVEEA